jgi:hypothetical protein
MKTLKEIRDKFDALVRQRDTLTDGSAARAMVNQRITALAWVIDHSDVPELLLSQDAADLFDCLA